MFILGEKKHRKLFHVKKGNLLQKDFVSPSTIDQSGFVQNSRRISSKPFLNLTSCHKSQTRFELDVGGIYMFYNLKKSNVPKQLNKTDWF